MSVLATAKDPERGIVSGIVPGQQVRARLACARKDRQTARNGSPYLSLVLRDRSGEITARAFRDVDLIGSRFERGDAVEVVGRAVRFRGEIQLELEDVRRLEPSEMDPAELLPRAYRDLDELEGFLEHLLGEIHDPALRRTTERALSEEPTGSELRRAPCTRGGHHAYLGGLLEHTVAVATMVTELRQLHPRLDSDLLMAAALVHDLGKTREFTYGAEIGLSEEGRLLGHLTLGAELVATAAAAAGLGEERRVTLLHCLLTHHGADGRPGGFAIPEAVALYRLNALDAGVKAALERGA